MTLITHNLPNAAGDAPLPGVPGADLPGAQPVPEEVPRGMAAEAWHRLRRSKTSLACLAVVAVYLLVGLASFLPVFDRKIEEQFSAEKTYAPPALRYAGPDGKSRIAPAVWFGLDFQGRSVFWRVLYGTRIALTITVCASVLSIGIGAVLGVLSGYYGGWIDDLITWLFSTVSSVPWLLLVMAVSYTLKEGGGANPNSAFDLIVVILSLGLTDWVSLCRLMRGEVIKLRDRDFVMAGRALGLGQGRIIFRHILPNTMHLIIITFSLGAVSYVQVEVILSFLGIGITSKPSWGRMIDDAKLALLRGVWWEVTAATAAIFVLSLALNLLGDALRDALDPRLRGVE